MTAHPRQTLLDLIGPWVLAALFYGGLALAGLAWDEGEVIQCGPHVWHVEYMMPHPNPGD